MFSAEGGFAFILVPLYYLACVLAARHPRLHDAGWRVLFPLNWAIAAVGFSAYSALTDFGAGKWLGVGLISGFVAASIGTALALGLRGGARDRRLGDDERVMVYHFETFDGEQMRYVKSRIRATLAAIEDARGKALMDSGRSVAASDLSPSGFLIFGTNS
jgi:hypothetical protein